MIRPATPTDAEALTSCIAAAYARYAAQGIALPDVTEGVAEDIAQHLVWVHEAAGDVAGGIIISRTDDQAHVMNLAVHPDHAGKGVGSGLVRAAMAYLKEVGVTEVHLATHVDMPQNIALYAHLGWREAGRDGNKVLMARRL